MDSTQKVQAQDSVYRSIAVEKEKYTFISFEKDYRIHCLRYNAPWMIFEKGNKAIGRLMSEYSELKTENIELKHESLRLGLLLNLCLDALNRMKGG